MTIVEARAKSSATNGHRFPNGRWRDSAHPEPSPILDAAIAVLTQGIEMLGLITAEMFARRLPVAFNASIGAHYRHCLDHFTSLIDGLDRDEVDYDHRQRDARLETDLELARAVTDRLCAMLRDAPASALNRPVIARCEVSYGEGGSPVTRSSFERELAYVIAHTIHHYALIAIMARLMGSELPKHFGVAPSTVEYQRRLAG